MRNLFDNLEEILKILMNFLASSTTMMFCLYELAQNQEIQDKLRDEIKETLEKNDGKLTYDSMIEMTYMQMVIDG